VRRLVSLFASLLIAIQGCVKPPPPPPGPAASPHYFLGKPYQAGGHWYYPAENYGLDETGIATVQTGGTGLTADGERVDPSALTGAMQTIQLPAIVQVTNLLDGRQIELRVNDRGPASPSRIIALSPRAALFLQIPANGAAPVRVQVDEALSRRLVDQLGGGPKLQIATAPSAAITAESLPPPGGGTAGPARTIGGTTQEAAQPRVPDRLPEAIRMVYVGPRRLYLRCGSFGRFDYANVVAAKLSGLGADVLRSPEGRQSVFAVRVGPFDTIAQADRALDEALRDGVIDAHITAE
jgi:rare lipoprotein A